jgi:hypothetical protein
VRWLAGELVLGTHLVGHRRSKSYLQLVVTPLFIPYSIRRFICCVHTFTAVFTNVPSHLEKPSQDG